MYPAPFFLFFGTLTPAVRRKYNAPMKINFRSDNESPAAEAVMQAVVEANAGPAWAYAEDDWSERLDTAFSELFETETTVVPISTGTVANSIALASVTPPWGSVYCGSHAHIYSDESGAPEFFGNGLRKLLLETAAELPPWWETLGTRTSGSTISPWGCSPG